jgi:hypothetical protein
MFDGRVFVYGLAGKSYIYTPGATPKDPGTWAVGPAMLGGDEAEDEYSDTLPNGLVVGALVQVMFGPGVVWQAFDPTTNTVMSVAPPPDPGNPYPISYVNLPNGQVMVDSEAADGPNWILTPSTGPQDAWRPTVESVVYNGSGTYTLTGTQISGLINGGDEGDDMTMQENYPIVWLQNSAGNVYYCRTFNISSMTPSKGSAPQTCDFTTPAGLPAGTYDLYVSAVGVPSKNPFPFTPGQSSSASSTSSSAASSTASSGTGSTSGASSGSASTSGATSVTGTATTTTGTSRADGGATTETATGTAAGPGGSGSGGVSNSPGCGCRTAGGSAGAEGWASVFALVGAAVFLGRRRQPRG